MVINDKKSTAEIKEEFSKLFPNLKIEFYNKEHAYGEGNSQENIMQEDLKIGTIRKDHYAAEFSILPGIRVSEFEKAFHDIYDLNIQVYRRSGDLWLQTTSTDHWTLEKQNEVGQSH